MTIYACRIFHLNGSLSRFHFEHDRFTDDDLFQEAFYLLNTPAEINPDLTDVEPILDNSGRPGDLFIITDTATNTTRYGLCLPKGWSISDHLPSLLDERLRRTHYVTCEGKQLFPLFT